MKVNATESGIKQMEMMMLLAAMTFISIGLMVVKGAVDPMVTNSLIMGMVLVMVGFICGGVYIYIEKNDGDEESEPVDTSKVNIEGADEEEEPDDPDDKKDEAKAAEKPAEKPTTEKKVKQKKKDA